MVLSMRNWRVETTAHLSGKWAQCLRQSSPISARLAAGGDCVSLTPAAFFSSMQECVLHPLVRIKVTKYGIKQAPLPLLAQPHLFSPSYYTAAVAAPRGRLSSGFLLVECNPRLELGEMG